MKGTEAVQAAGESCRGLQRCAPARMSATRIKNSVAMSGGISCCVVHTNARSPLCGTWIREQG